MVSWNKKKKKKNNENLLHIVNFEQIWIFVIVTKFFPSIVTKVS